LPNGKTLPRAISAGFQIEFGMTRIGVHLRTLELEIAAKWLKTAQVDIASS
jgi:hypothetical protein